jgi:uncharacterized protein (TIGR02757 family)
VKKSDLERIRNAIEGPERLAVDPLGSVPREASMHTQEVAAFMCAGLAFGTVKAIGHSVARVVQHLDSATQLAQINHRWVRGADIRDVVAQLRRLQAQYGSLEEAFLCAYEAGNMRTSLIHFSALLRDGLTKTRGCTYLTSSPSAGSACKRLNLFLRWMVRSDGVDLGLWTRVSPQDLIMPIDVHVQKFAQKAGISTRKSVNWKMAEEVTAAFRRICPEDPLRYDFAISHYGMVHGWDNL